MEPCCGRAAFHRSAHTLVQVQVFRQCRQLAQEISFSGSAHAVNPTRAAAVSSRVAGPEHGLHILSFRTHLYVQYRCSGLTHSDSECFAFSAASAFGCLGPAVPVLPCPLRVDAESCPPPKVLKASRPCAPCPPLRNLSSLGCSGPLPVQPGPPEPPGQGFLPRSLLSHCEACVASPAGPGVQPASRWSGRDGRSATGFPRQCATAATAMVKAGAERLLGLALSECAIPIVQARPVASDKPSSASYALCLRVVSTSLRRFRMAQRSTSPSRLYDEHSSAAAGGQLATQHTKQRVQMQLEPSSGRHRLSRAPGFVQHDAVPKRNADCTDMGLLQVPLPAVLVTAPADVAWHSRHSSLAPTCRPGKSRMA